MKSYDELKTELEDIQLQMAEAKLKERAIALKEVKRLCKEFGFTAGMIKGTLALSVPEVMSFARILPKKALGRLFKLFKLHVLKDELVVELARWHDDRGDEILRFDYPSLNENSVVFDLGGYVGDFAAEIYSKYGCKVYLFEPHPEFYGICLERFEGNDKIIPLNYGVSNVAGKFELSNSLNSSSFLNSDYNDKNILICELRSFFDVLEDLAIDRIALMKINIEGSEFALLELMAHKCGLSVVDSYQIQFHNFIEGAVEKRDAITASLGKTHNRTWCYTFVWENWEIK